MARTFYTASFKDSIGRRRAIDSCSELGAKIHGGILRARIIRAGWGPVTDMVIEGPFREDPMTGLRG